MTRMKFYKMERKEFEKEVDFGDYLCYTTEDDDGNVFAVDVNDLVVFSGGVAMRDTVEKWERRARTIIELAELVRNLEKTNNPLVKGIRRMRKCEVCATEFPYKGNKIYCSEYCARKAERQRKQERQIRKRIARDCV